MDIGTLQASLGADLGPLNSSVRQAESVFQRYQRMGTRSLNIVKNAVFSLQGALAGVGGAFVIADTIRKGAQFEQTMQRVRAVANATAEEFQQLTKIAEQLGETTEFTATQAAEGLEFLSMAGFQAVDSVEALPDVLNLATAGSIDLGRAADIASNVLTALRMDTEELARVNDVLVAGFTNANVNMENLAESFKYAGSVGAAFGYTIEEITGFIGQLGNAGIQGSMAGTQLAQAFQTVNKVFDEYRQKGIDVSQYTENLTGALQLLEDQGASASEVMDIFGERAGRGVAALLGIGTDAIDEYINKLRNARGETERIAEEFRSTTIGQFNALNSAIQSLQIDLFNEQTGALNQTLQDMTMFVRENKEEIIDLVNEIVDWAKNVGGLIKDVASLVLSIENLSTVINFATGALLTFTGIKIASFLAGIVSGVGKAVMGFAALATATQTANAALAAYGVTSYGAISASTGIGTAILGALGGPAGIGVAGALVGGGVLFSYREEIKQAIDPVRKLQAEHNELIEETIVLNNRIDNLTATYRDLSSQSNLTVSEQLELQRTLDELTTIFPDITDGAEDYIEILDRLDEQTRKLELEQAFASASSEIDILNEKIQETLENMRRLDPTGQALGRGMFGGGGIVEGLAPTGETEKRFEELRSNLIKTGEQINEYKDIRERAEKDLKYFEEFGFTFTEQENLTNILRQDLFGSSVGEYQEKSLDMTFDIPVRFRLESKDSLSDLAQEEQTQVITTYQDMMRELTDIRKKQERELSLINLEGFERRKQQIENSTQERIDTLIQARDDLIRVEDLTNSERTRLQTEYNNRIIQETINKNQQINKIEQEFLQEREKLLQQELRRQEEEIKRRNTEREREFQQLQNIAQNITFRYDPQTAFQSRINELENLRETINEETGEPLISDTVFERARLEEMNRLKRSMQDVLMLSREWKDGMIVALSEYSDAATNAADNFYRVWRSALDRTEDALVDFIDTGKLNFKDLADSVRRDLSRMFVRQYITGPLAQSFGQSQASPQNAQALFGGNQSTNLFSSIGNFFGGFFEDGGTTDKDKWYVVGESGPELFIPQTNGQVFSNEESNKILSEINNNKFGGFLQNGGDVDKRKYYIVGENGKELFITDSMMNEVNDMGNVDQRFYENMEPTSFVDIADKSFDESINESISNISNNNTSFRDINIYQSTDGNGFTTTEPQERKSDKQMIEEVANQLMEASL